MPVERAPRIVVMLLITVLVTGRVSRGLGQQPAPLGRRIVSIELACAAAVDRQDLMRLMPMHVGDQLRAGDLDEARRRINETHLFTEITIETEPRDSGLAIVVRLVRETIVNRIRFRGNHAVSDDELRRVIRLPDGSEVTEKLRDYAVKRLRERYQKEGFEATTVNVEMRTRTPGEVDITFRIDEGPPLRIRAVEIEGAGPVAVDDVRHAAGMRVGDRFVRAQMRTAQTAIVRLYRSKHYYEVEVKSDWEHGSGVMRFAIEPGPPFVVTFSGNQHFSDAHLLGLMDLPERPIVTDGTWRELAHRAERAYQEAGYYFARVNLRMEAGPPKVVRFDVSEDGVFHAADVEFEGNQGLSARVLRAQMATRPPSWIPWQRGVFLDDVLDDDLKRLWYFYRRNGFEDAQIVDARTSIDRDRGKIVATVVIEEGRQTIVHEIVRVGVEPIAGSLPAARVTVGEPLDPEKVEADQRALVTAFARAGYTHADVQADTVTTPSADTDAASVRFVATLGRQERVGTVIVQNNVDTRSRVILRELPFNPGDPLDPDALLRGQSNIYRLGLFRSVTVRPLEGPTDPASRDVGVSVAEKPAGTMQWGAGYNTRDGFRGFVEVGHSNLGGLARRLSLRGEFTFDPVDLTSNQYVGNLGFREPHLADTQWTLRTNLLAQRSTRLVDQFSFERLAFIPAVERTLLPGLQAGVEMQAEQSKVFDVASDVLLFNPRDDGQLRTVSIGPFAIYDGRDDPFVPRRGVYDSLRFRYAPGALGSEVPFFKLVGQHSQYIPLD
jgi:outer membrane protein insertion porin family